MLRDISWILLYYFSFSTKIKETGKNNLCQMSFNVNYAKIRWKYVVIRELSRATKFSWLTLEMVDCCRLLRFFALRA